MNTTLLPNFHAIEVKYIPPGNVLGSRVKLTSARFNKSITISYDHEYDNALECGVAALQARGFDIIGTAECKNAYIVITSTFKTLEGVKA